MSSLARRTGGEESRGDPKRAVKWRDRCDWERGGVTYTLPVTMKLRSDSAPRARVATRCRLFDRVLKRRRAARAPRPCQRKCLQRGVGSRGSSAGYLFTADRTTILDLNRVFDGVAGDGDGARGISLSYARAFVSSPRCCLRRRARYFTMLC